VPRKSLRPLMLWDLRPAHCLRFSYFNNLAQSGCHRSVADCARRNPKHLTMNYREGKRLPNRRSDGLFNHGIAQRTLVEVLPFC
jgi:hypothetical protein